MEDTKSKLTLFETNGSEDREEPPIKKAKEMPVDVDEKEGASDPKDVGRPEVLPTPEPLSGEALKLSLGQEDEALPKPETSAAEVLKSSSDQKDDSLPNLETLAEEAVQPAIGAEVLESSAVEADQSIFGPQNNAFPNLMSLVFGANPTEEQKELLRRLLAEPKPPTVILMGGEISDSGDSSGDEIVVNVKYLPN